MRVLLLCNKSPWPPKDGGAAATLNLITGLTYCNVSVTVLAFNTAKHFVKTDDIPEKFSKSTNYHFINLDSGINPIKFFTNLLFSDKPYNLERFWSRAYSSELKKIIQNNFDIVQIEGLAMYHYLPVIRNCTSVPVVYRPHNIENLIWAGLSGEEKNVFKSSYFKILSRRLKKIEKSIINDFDAVVPLSSPDLDWFKAEGLSKPYLKCVPGYHPDEITEYEPSPINKVFFIGALDWLPNIFGLAWFIKKVWPIVVDKIPDATLYIAGRNASKKTMSRLQGKNIFFKGEVESSSDFIRDKMVMIVPLFSGSGIRMKIIEGMNYGKCVVATPLAIKGLECEHNKDIYVTSEASSFADIITELLTNEELRREAGINAMNNVRKNYNILASSEKLKNFYRELTA
jgi:glycosyltransferase involved in cell wall biosynthesis